MTILEAARKYHESGFHVIPVDGKKRPACPKHPVHGYKWKHYSENQSEEDIEFLFSGNPYGIAILTGINGLEVVDVDTKYDIEGGLFYRFMKLNDEVNDNSVPFTSLCLIETTSGGYHVIYRCPEPGPNDKLALRNATEEEQAQGDTIKVLIETRGVGGYAVAYPTQGYTIQHGNPFNLRTISQSQRLDLIRAAKHFDEVAQPVTHTPPKEYKQPVGGVTPWEDFRQNNDAVDILLSHGWTRVFEDSQRIYLKRPGNTDSRMSGNWHKQKEMFICHSTSTVFQPGKGYTTDAVYAMLEHGGDFKKSARQLIKDGYGTPIQQPLTDVAQTEESVDNQLQEQVNNDRMEKLLAFVKSTRFDVTAPIRDEKATLIQHFDGKKYKVAGPGMIAGVVGPKKSSKTSVVAAIVASALSQKPDPVLTFSLDVEGKNILYIDTEQSSYFYKKTQAMIHSMAGVYRNTSQYEAYHLRQLPAASRLKVLDYMLEGRDDLGLIVIDGIKDLLRNINSEDESAEVMEYLMKWSDQTKAMMIGVLHTTKQNGFVRGHIGTEFENKYDVGILTEKDPELKTFNVKCRDSRFAPFHDFTFEKDEKGFPVMDLWGDLDDTPAPQPSTQFPVSQPSSIITRPSKKNDDDDIPF
jgi:hypothetical protein